MKNMSFQHDPVLEAQFQALCEAESQRKDKLLAEFEKLERKERKWKKQNHIIFQRKYERLTRGLYFVEKKTGDHVHLVNENGKDLGVLQVPPEVSQLLRINDGLEGTFGFRNGYWRVQFLFCLVSSAEDFMPEDLLNNLK